MNFLNQDDPLGIAMKLRGMANRQEFDRQNPPMSGPLPDPQWEGFFQSLQDQGVTGLRAAKPDPGTNQLRGYGAPPYQTTMWNEAQSSAPLRGLTYAQGTDLFKKR